MKALFIMIVVIFEVACNEASQISTGCDLFSRLYMTEKEHVLTGHSFLTQLNTTRVKCASLCSRDKTCVSFNHDDINGTCQLNNARKEEFPNSFVEDSRYSYYFSLEQSIGETTTGSVQTSPSSTTRQITTGSEEGGLMWPSGFYGLPTPTSGCPNNSGVVWETGSRFQHTEDVDPNNYWYPSTGTQLLGPYIKNETTQNFCMKTHNHTDQADGDWPQGRYCVFKYGQSCPKTMSSGFIYWDDEDSNNKNKVQGTVPSGVYDQNTRIEYCCMTDGDASQPISLPTENPFYLFPYNSELCQGVQGMTSIEEYVRWDEQDYPSNIQVKSGGTHPYLTEHSSYGANDNIVHYCYYEVINFLNR